jgi:REP element-mobilizing transposase RayT
MRPVIAYHVTFSIHGFWLPNDPRGSGSLAVRFEPLQAFGPATYDPAPRSVARRPHDGRSRQAAKTLMKYPEVVFDGRQALSVGCGFAAQIKKSEYRIYACSILPQHVHLVIARRHYPIEQVVRLLRQAGTARLLADGLHPFAALRGSNGRLPSIWTQDFRKVFLFTPTEVVHRVQYVEDNPEKEGKRRQRWPFTVPFDPGNL